MSDEAQAMERSALQKKDRAELITIATAMGEKPGSRAKKADVIDLILELAGVSTPSDGAADAKAATATAEPETADAKAAEAAAAGTKAASTRTAKPKASDAGDAATDDEAADDEAADDDAADDDAADGSSDEADGRQGRGTQQGGQGQPRGRGGRQNKDEANKDQEGESQSDQQGKGRGNQQAKGQGSQQDQQAKGRGNQQGQGSQDQQGKGQGSQSQGGQQDQQGKGQGGQQGNQQGRGGQQDQQNQGQQGDADADGHDPEPGNRRRRRRGRDRQPQDDSFQGDPVDVVGFLDLRDEGYGFLRVNGYLPSPDDVYVSVKQTRQFNLRKGDQIAGASRPASRNEKNPALLRIDTINGKAPDSLTERPVFDELTPLFPDERLRLEAAGDPYNMTARIVDLIAPIGKGQRGLIVSPPKAGKTSVMKQIVRSIETNNPEVKLIVLLVDERPEEVTDMRRWVKNGEVAASTFDRPPEEHTAVSELVIERAKRMVEAGDDVVIILDGITRLARAYNLSAPQSGRVMSGGVDAAALYPPKKFFGAARNVEEGGSLTILATALVETGSRMDEVIFEEFKGTGNMELRLDRRLSERRIYPAIDVDGSGTRHEELLFTPKALQQVWKLRRVLSGMASESGSGAAGIELLTDRMRTFKNNDAFLDEIAKGPSGT